VVDWFSGACCSRTDRLSVKIKCNFDRCHFYPDQSEIKFVKLEK
jgi:hypothetical protein